MENNVYIVNKSSHDMDDAKRFGDLIFMTKGSQSRFATNNIYRQFLPILEGSQKSDYILLTGLTVMNVIACSIFVLLHKKLNLLIHRPKDNTYVERQLEFSDIENLSMTELIKDLKES